MEAARSKRRYPTATLHGITIDEIVDDVPPHNFATEWLRFRPGCIRWRSVSTRYLMTPFQLLVLMFQVEVLAGLCDAV
jgi:hypothetical protein